MNKDVKLPKVLGKEVGHWRLHALNEDEITDDIVKQNKGRTCISFAAAARYIGVKEEQAQGILVDVPRRTIGKRDKIHARDLARFVACAMTFK